MLVAAVALALAACSAQAPGSPPAPADKLRIQRPGYRSGPATADPAALVSQPGGRPVSYGGRPVVQACRLLTPEDVRAAGLRLFPNPLTGPVTRTFFDGQGRARLPVTPYLSLVSSPNQCEYLLESGRDRGSVNVEVYQTSYADPEAMTTELRGPRPAAPIAGVRVYVERARPGRGDDARYLLARGDALVRLAIHTPGAGERARSARSLLRTAARRLAARPAGPGRFRYQSPVFEGEAANGCELTDRASFRSIFHVEPSPLVEERVATAVGVVKTSGAGGPGGGGEFNYIDHDCVRRSVAGPTQARTLEVDTTTFERADAAEQWFQAEKRFARGIVPAQEGVGDEAFYAERRLDGKDASLTFRKGRVVVVMGYYDHGRPVGQARERLRVLSPVARAMAGRMSGF